ncbi:acyltransferase [Pseudoalteromonas sp. SIMBA_148]
MAFLTRQQLKNIGFKSVGSKVYISDKVSIYGAQNISIGNNVRIDDFVVLSAGDDGIEIGNYIHIAVFSSLIGAGKILLEDFCNISSRVSIYSSSDDYSGSFMSNPMVSNIFTNVTKAPVTLCKHVIVGCGSVVLPGVRLHEGCAIGALSLINKSIEKWTIYAGVPAIKIKERSNKCVKLEAEFIVSESIKSGN